MKKNLIIISLLLFVGNLFAQESARTYNEAVEKAKVKDHAGAFDLFVKAIELKKTEDSLPVKDKWYYYAGKSALEIKKFDEAVKYTRLAIESGSTDGKTYDLLSNVYKEQKDDANYEKTMLEGIEKNPADADLNKSIGLFYYNQTAAKQKGIAPLATSNTEKYLEELKKIKPDFEKSSGYLTTASTNYAKAATDAKNDNQKNAANKQKQTCDTAIEQIKKAIKDIDAALAAKK